MTKVWFAAATSFRASVQAAVPRPLPSHEVLQRRMDSFGPRRDAARSAPLETPPQPLDARLLADGEALESAWQAELRAMRRELPKACQSSPEPMKSRSYQMKEKPLQLPLRELLKE